MSSTPNSTDDDDDLIEFLKELIDVTINGESPHKIVTIQALLSSKALTEKEKKELDEHIENSQRKVARKQLRTELNYFVIKEKYDPITGIGRINAVFAKAGFQGHEANYEEQYRQWLKFQSLPDTPNSRAHWDKQIDAMRNAGIQQTKGPQHGSSLYQDYLAKHYGKFP